MITRRALSWWLFGVSVVFAATAIYVSIDRAQPNPYNEISPARVLLWLVALALALLSSILALGIGLAEFNRLPKPRPLRRLVEAFAVGIVSIAVVIVYCGGLAWKLLYQ